MINIALVSHYGSMTGGGGVAFSNICTYLNKSKFKLFCIFGKKGPLVEQIQNLGIHTIVIPFHPVNRYNMFPYLVSLVRLFFYLLFHRIHIVHLNTIVYRDPSLLAAKLLGIKVIAHFRAPQKIENWLRTANLYLFNSNDTLNKSVDSDRDRAKSKVLYNEVDLSRFIKKDKKIIKKELGFSTNTLLVGYFGKVRPVKGTEYFMKMAREVSSRRNNVSFVIAGGKDDVDPEGRYLKEMKRLANELGIEEKIRFYDWLPDIEKLYSAIDIFVLPSIEEPFGRVLIEAGASATAVVATSVGGIPEVIDNGVNGILVPPKDAGFLTEAVIKLIDSPLLCNELGSKLREKVENNYELNKQLEKLELIYQQLVTSNK